ncbi:hypothetical protein DL765_002076 [Monosporascus sp. GIB2]|nr:hypothetical protein DL765_002076 [Monosporascus sp. GIB2]
MSQIYLSARSVLVWLGDGPDMDKCINFLWGLSSSRHESSVTADRADNSIKEELKRFFGHTRPEVIQRFFALPWFRRRWVVQEAARGARFYCGSIDISSHSFHQALYVLNKSTLPFDREVIDHIANLEAVSEMYEHGKNDSPGCGILDMLVRFNSPACSDERDRIYAYLGLANDVRSPYANTTTPEGRWPTSSRRFDDFLSDPGSDTPSRKRSTRIGIQVDYDAEPNHIYAAFAEQMLQHKPNLDILHCAGAFRPSLNSMSDLRQSWTPDWRIPMRYTPLLSVPWFAAGGPDVKSEPFLNYPWCSVEGFSFDAVAVSCKIPGLDTAYSRDTRVMPPVAGTPGGLTGKRVKRNASERDMHTLLDWWTETRESGLSVSNPVSASRGKAKSALGVSIQPHIKALHRTALNGSFLKPSATEGEWGPTSYEQQSHYHGRISDETERYFVARHMILAKETTWKKKRPNKPADRKRLHGRAKTEVPKGGDNMMVGQGPGDEPYDCEWRLRDNGWVCFQPHVRNLERYAELAHNTLRGRSLFVTSRGYIGIGPDDVAPDDMVVVLHGARTPFIPRKSHKPGYWRLVGDCYVHGIMGGEALDMDLDQEVDDAGPELPVLGRRQHVSAPDLPGVRRAALPGGFAAHFCMYVLFNISLAVLHVLLVRHNKAKRAAAAAAGSAEVGFGSAG